MGEVPRSVAEADVEVDEAEEVTEDMAHREEGQKSKYKSVVLQQSPSREDGSRKKVCLTIETVRWVESSCSPGVETQPPGPEQAAQHTVR